MANDTEHCSATLMPGKLVCTGIRIYCALAPGHEGDHRFSELRMPAWLKELARHMQLTAEGFAGITRIP